MSHLSFEIKTSKDFLKKLLDDFHEFGTDKLSSRVALNCAVTAWHLTEWVYNEFSQQLSPRFSKLYLFQEHIKQECPSLQIMHDLANGTKHYTLLNHRPIIEDTELHDGDFNDDFSREFDISILEINLKTGTKIYFEDEIEKVVSFWRSYLERTFEIVIKEE